MERESVKEAVEGWETVLGQKVEVRDIEGNHFEVFEGSKVSFSSYTCSCVSLWCGETRLLCMCVVDPEYQ